MDEEESAWVRRRADEAESGCGGEGEWVRRRVVEEESGREGEEESG